MKNDTSIPSIEQELIQSRLRPSLNFIERTKRAKLTPLVDLQTLLNTELPEIKN